MRLDWNLGRNRQERLLVCYKNLCANLSYFEFFFVKLAAIVYSYREITFFYSLVISHRFQAPVPALIFDFPTAARETGGEILSSPPMEAQQEIQQTGEVQQSGEAAEEASATNVFLKVERDLQHNIRITDRRPQTTSTAAKPHLLTSCPSPPHLTNSPVLFYSRLLPPSTTSRSWRRMELIETMCSACPRPATAQ